MASELLPCPFCGGTDLSSGGDDKFVGYFCKTCQATGPNHYGSRDWNTRPAPAATDTGLETFSVEMLRDYAFMKSDPEGDYVTRSQAVELLAAERAESDEAYELGKRDGYSEAVQEIDLKTGGDGEYRYCTDHDPDRHTPDPASMIQRIAERFETLNTMESISEINEWKERAEKAEADNAAKDARVKAHKQQKEAAVDNWKICAAQIEALEAKLAAYEKSGARHD